MKHVEHNLQNPFFRNSSLYIYIFIIIIIELPFFLLGTRVCQLTRLTTVKTRKGMWRFVHERREKYKRLTSQRHTPST